MDSFNLFLLTGTDLILQGIMFPVFNLSSIRHISNHYTVKVLYVCRYATGDNPERGKRQFLIAFFFYFLFILLFSDHAKSFWINYTYTVIFVASRLSRFSKRILSNLKEFFKVAHTKLKNNFLRRNASQSSGK